MLYDIPPQHYDFFNRIFDQPLTKISVIKNPTEYELNSFIYNTKAKEIRGLNINNNYFYIDAFISDHLILFDILIYNNIIPQNTRYSDNYRITKYQNLGIYKKIPILNQIKNLYTINLGDLYDIYKNDLPQEYTKIKNQFPLVIYFLSSIYPNLSQPSNTKDNIDQFLNKIYKL